MHYKGLLRVARREAGIRIYALQQPGAPRRRAPSNAGTASTDWSTPSSARSRHCQISRACPLSSGACATPTPLVS